MIFSKKFDFLKIKYGTIQFLGIKIGLKAKTFNKISKIRFSPEVTI